MKLWNRYILVFWPFSRMRRVAMEVVIIAFVWLIHVILYVLTLTIWNLNIHVFCYQLTMNGISVHILCFFLSFSFFFDKTFYVSISIPSSIIPILYIWATSQLAAVWVAWGCKIMCEENFCYTQSLSEGNYKLSFTVQSVHIWICLYFNYANDFYWIVLSLTFLVS